jgi:hypothetical protein
MTVFISYSQDSARVTLLVEALRRHGLRTWRDQDHLDQGAATEATIEAELAGCDTAMVWLGGNTLTSDFVNKIELPLIFQHHATRGLRIVPLFVDVDVPTGTDAVRAATGLEIGSNNGYPFDPGRTLDQNLAEIANREVRAALAQGAQASTGIRPAVRCVTRSDAAGGRHLADLNFDWINEYPADGIFPDTTTVDVLQTALHTSLQHLIASYGPGTADLYLKCHLHLGVAIGFELRRVTGIRPRVDVDETWWDIDVNSTLEDADPLDERVVNGPAGGLRTALGISLSRDVQPMVSNYVATTGTTYRRRVELTPPSGPDQHAVSTSNVNAWADQAADALRSLRALPGTTATDVFMSAPVGFAVALGWRLNAIGGIHLFHPNGNAGPYVPVWSIPPS